MPPNVRALLFDMQHAAHGIRSFADGRTIDDFKSDLMFRSAVERQFEIIGEAVARLRKLEPAYAAIFTEFHGIISFRNVLIRGYDTINNDVTWRIVQTKLPILLAELETQLSGI
jgi:uncharacterized protein with HEPN domain